MNLSAYIDVIGAKLVACQKGCEGIACNQEIGVLPRCLMLETEGRSQEMGSVIVGLNPGRSKTREREFYRLNGQTYDQEKAFWDLEISQHQYYKRLRRLVDDFGLSGAILWTELVKCENSAADLPPLQTFRTCSDTYLKQELKEIPDSWPLIAVGRKSYDALAYMFAERIVVGVPHPTGSFGNHFHGLFGSDLQARFTEISKSTPNQAIWLPD